MMRIFSTATVLVLCCAAPVLADGHAGVPTKEIQGLEGPSKGRGISNAVIGNHSLADEGIASLAGRTLRTRFWTIKKNGLVPIHDHSKRPAVFTIASGEIFEYTSLSETRVFHQGGNLALEEGSLAHWWLNQGGETVHLIAFDVVPPRGEIPDVAPVPTAVPVDMPVAVGSELELLGAVDIGAHFGDGTGAGWVLSTYRATIEPGGALLGFTDAGEPLQVFAWQGRVTEHRASGATEIANREGTTVAGGEAAYWTNDTDAPAIVYFGAVEPASEIEGVPRVGPLAHGKHGG